MPNWSKLLNSWHKRAWSGGPIGADRDLTSQPNKGDNSETWFDSDEGPTSALKHNLAEFERSLIAERVKAGRQRAKAQGKHTGRPRLPEATRRAARELLREGQLSRRAIGKRLGISHEIVRLIAKEPV